MKGKNISRDFGFELGRLAHRELTSVAVRKSLWNGKKTLYFMKILRDYALR